MGGEEGEGEGRVWRALAVEARPVVDMSSPTMRVQPSRANWRTQARPMEPPAPVMRATLERLDGRVVLAWRGRGEGYPGRSNPMVTREERFVGRVGSKGWLLLG